MKYNKQTFYCFSPPVMLATMIIEFGLALYALWRYKWNAVTCLAVTLLVALGAFQLAEYMVCQDVGSAVFWSRLGFVAITILPPVGLHLLHAISRSKQRWIPWPGYLAGAAFAVFFGFWSESITDSQCLGNYVIFQVAHYAGGLYAAYYYGLLAVTLLLGWYYLRRSQPKRRHRAIAALMAGYAIFLIPTTAAVLINPQTLTAIPSVMCGFAVLLAIVLGVCVLPSGAQRK